MYRIIILLVASFATLPLTACNSGPSLPAACLQPPESGRCRAAHVRWWYDQRSATCKAFTWGGCGGSVPFETREDCQAQCMADQQLPAAAGNDIATEPAP